MTKPIIINPRTRLIPSTHITRPTPTPITTTSSSSHNPENPNPTTSSTIPSSKMHKLLSIYAICALAALVLAAPLDGNLNLEGLSNKIRSGAVAIASPGRPSDSRIQRVVSQDGVILTAEGESIGPDREAPEAEPDVRGGRGAV